MVSENVRTLAGVFQLITSATMTMIAETGQMRVAQSVVSHCIYIV